jgi:hypothetical protein
MAEISKSGTPSLSSVLPNASANKLTGLLAGEDIAAGDACYIKAADGKVWRSTGAAANAAAKVRGWAGIAAKSGEAVTLVFEVNMRYGAALTPGADYFLSGTVAGGIADAASTGGTAPIAYAIDATRIRVMQSRY